MYTSGGRGRCGEKKNRREKYRKKERKLEHSSIGSKLTYFNLPLVPFRVAVK